MRGGADVAGAKERWAEMRRQGLCPIVGCGKDTGGFAFCPAHREAQARANARRRAAGLSVNLSMKKWQAVDLDYVSEQWGLSRQETLRVMIDAVASEVRRGRMGKPYRRRKRRRSA